MILTYFGGAKGGASLRDIYFSLSLGVIVADNNLNGENLTLFHGLYHLKVVK